MRQNTVTFANFICKFGREQNLLDYVDEIVIPAYLESREARKYGDATYYLLSVGVENIGTPEAPIAALAGRFVKQTILKRTQILDPEKGLSKDERSMESAPSSFFILRLDIHRLIYFAETPDAPDLRSFALASNAIIRRRHDEFINSLYNQHNEDGDKVTKKSLREKNPEPNVVVIPLTSQNDISSFISRYSKLQKIEFHLVRPNDEIDGQAMWRALRETTERLGAENTKVEHRNSDGLDTTQAVQEVVDASATGNQIVKMSGLDEEGNRLSGNNENYQLSVSIDNVPETKRGLIDRLYNIFKSLVSDGDIKFDQKQVSSNAERMIRIVRDYVR